VERYLDPARGAYSAGSTPAQRGSG